MYSIVMRVCGGMTRWYRPSHTYNAGREHVGFHQPGRHCLHQDFSGCGVYLGWFLGCVFLVGRLVHTMQCHAMLCHAIPSSLTPLHLETRFEDKIMWN